MAVGASGVAQAGDGFTVAAFPVLADEETGVFSVYGEHPLLAAGTSGVGQIVVTEGSFGGADFVNQFISVGFYLLDEIVFLSVSLCNVGQLHLPCSGEFWLFQVLWDKFQKLFSF